ncbi:MAG: hypothetical protein HY953_00665, partial [Candidatus Rokubacteria bacterium]|nr:hypothetical protein [Candidatus Rokubacteria bacterium]
RGIFIGAAFLLIDPGLLTDVIGLALLGVGLLLQRMRPAVVMAAARSVG